MSGEGIGSAIRPLSSSMASNLWQGLHEVGVVLYLVVERWDVEVHNQHTALSAVTDVGLVHGGLDVG